MADLGMFSDDAFSVSSLTAAINEQEAAPSIIGDSGLFLEEGISTTTFSIEKDGDTLALVEAKDRGAPGTVVNDSKRQAIPFNTIHLPTQATIMADEIQNVRAFGQTTELESMQDKINKRLAKMRRRIDATHEWQRIGAIKGKILDADGVTVLLDLYHQFGMTQQTASIALSNANTEMRVEADIILTVIEDALKNQAFVGAKVYCGETFWRQLIVHKTIKETYLNWQMAATLRGDPREAFDFGGITWERYRGKVNGVPFIAATEGYAFPLGVPEMFMSNYAPANYMETVNTEGLPYYAKQETLDFDKGVALEAQSNPLHICTRPQAVIKLTAV